MGEEEKDSKSNDHYPTIISYEDREIKEQKPPNDKIISYKIVDEKINSDSED
ncbi:MAG: hypothetical protein ACFFCV_01620 [Promethearchaeota archaeon]